MIVLAQYMWAENNITPAKHPDIFRHIENEWKRRGSKPIHTF